MSDDDKNKSLFSPLNANIPLGMIPFTESLKDTYNRVIPYYEKEIKKYLHESKNVLISAHGNSLRALCKYLFKISKRSLKKSGKTLVMRSFLKCLTKLTKTMMDL